LRAAHIGLIAALTAHSDANCKALEDRADHLQRVFAVLHFYVTAIIAETAQNIPGSTLDRRYLDHLFQQFDALGVIRSAAAEIRVLENWRVS
jgi:phage terminase Nu1 subunit (DNA packaging protein)